MLCLNTVFNADFMQTSNGGNVLGFCYIAILSINTLIKDHIQLTVTPFEISAIALLFQAQQIRTEALKLW